MSDKKFDWDINENFMASGANKAKSGSMRELLQKNAKMIENKRREEQLLKSHLPLLEVLFNTRIENQTPITVIRPIVYQKEELLRSDAGASYRAINDVINPGTELILSGYNPTLNQYIFTDQNNVRYELYESHKQSLMLNTNIITDLESFLSQKDD